MEHLRMVKRFCSISVSANCHCIENSQEKSYINIGEKCHQLSDESIFKKCLTLSQTTNFRIFQTERVCTKDNFRVDENGRKDRKHCGKRGNFSSQVISPFPTVFSKALYYRNVKIKAC